MKLSERLRLARFALVGIAVAALYVGSYAALVAMGLTEIFANLFAVIIAVIFQYIAQTAWTFQNRLLSRDQAMRFILTIGIGLLISTPITAFIGPSLEWPEYISATLVVIVSSITNYVLFTFWVYRKKDAVKRKRKT